MMGRLYRNRLHCLMKQKYRLVVTFFLPALIGTLLFWVLSDKTDQEMSERAISVAVVVKNGEDRQLLEALYQAGRQEGAPLFTVEECEEDEAVRLLQEGKIKGYVTDGGMRLFIRDSGPEEAALKLFIDQFGQWRDTKQRLESLHPQTPAAKRAMEGKSYVKRETEWKAEGTRLQFYALLSLACLLGTIWGCGEAVILEASRSAQGVRLTMTGLPKWKLSACHLLAAATVHIAGLFLLCFYLQWILKVDFGPWGGFAPVILIPAALFSVGAGALAASVFRGRERTVSLLLLAGGGGCAVIAGLLSTQMKYLAEAGISAFSWLNPAALITDALYALYDTGLSAGVFIRTGILWGLAFLFSIVCMIRLRREQYAAI